MGHVAALGLLGACFFVAGFATGLNDLLVPRFKELFSLDHARAGLVPASFFGGYFCFAPWAGRFSARRGAPAGFAAGTAVMAAGCGLFLVGLWLFSYPLCLAALCCLAGGMSFLLVSGNPYATGLGDPVAASRRLTLLVGFTPLGTACAGPLAGAVLFSPGQQGVLTLMLPYAVLAGLFVLLFFVVRTARWPASLATGGEAPGESRWWRHAQLRWGVPTMFAYVGGEVAIGSYLVGAAGLERFGAVSAVGATKLVGLYWGGAMVGRFVGPWYMKRLGTERVFTLHVLGALVCLGIFLSGTGVSALACLVAVGYCNSVLYPTIFALSLEGTGRDAPAGSAALCMSLVGGALVPLLQGLVADHMGLALSFIVPLACYLQLLAFAGFVAKRHRMDRVL